MLASTTGNIYGIYDMSGGSYEYVMGNMVDSSGAFYSSRADFSSAPNAKYYDKYTYNTDYGDHGRGKLGDATKETLAYFGSTNGGWYNDYSYFVSRLNSWFTRGGRYFDGSDAGAGIFSFKVNFGNGNEECGARAVLTP